jgi:hypothetical protein
MIEQTVASKLLCRHELMCTILSMQIKTENHETIVLKEFLIDGNFDVAQSDSV